MAEALVWSGVQVAVQSALATALPVTAVTKANPGVVTVTGSAPANGTYVYFSQVQGMTQIDGRVVRVISSSGSTFSMEGVDTTNFDTFTGGQVQAITYGTSLAIALSLNGSGGEAEQIDVTTIHDSIRKTKLGAFSQLVYSGTCIWDPSDPGFAALKAASEVKGTRAIRFTFPNGYKVVFAGQIGFIGVPTGSAQGVVETALTITVSGPITNYTT
jgi:hypothetical protein